MSILAFAAISLCACQKKIDTVATTVSTKGTVPATTTSQFVKYTIQKGEQFCDKNSYNMVNYQQLSFVVKFDSSAIYQTKSPSNQTDINKLFGFSDNNTQHHQFSARFGWRWSNNALRLFAYVYNNSVMTFKELGTVALGAEHTCSIKVVKDSYIFVVNDVETVMPRKSLTTVAQGYKLYPYFGGDELAPQTISIWIKEL